MRQLLRAVYVIDYPIQQFAQSAHISQLLNFKLNSNELTLS